VVGPVEVVKAFPLIFVRRNYQDDVALCVELSRCQLCGHVDQTTFNRRSRVSSPKSSRRVDGSEEEVEGKLRDAESSVTRSRVIGCNVRMRCHLRYTRSTLSTLHDLTLYFTVLLIQRSIHKISLQYETVE
jgi:hypothetical protein